MAAWSQARWWRRWAIVLCTTVLCVGLLTGCGDGWRNKNNTPAELTASRRDVAGSVVNASTIEAVVAAVITVSGTQVISGVDGGFRIPDLPRVDQSMTVVASGFQSQTLTLGATQDLVTVRLVPVGGGIIVPPPGTPRR